MSDNTSADHARGSYGSLLDYYFDRPASKESIRIGLKVGEIPSQAQAEELQKELAEALNAQEIIDSLTEEEKANMQKLAAISQSRRTKKQLDK